MLSVRQQFPIFTHQPDLVWLDSASSTQKPRSVIETAQRFYEMGYSNIHRGLYPLSERATADFEATRDVVKRFINAGEREEVVFTTGTTQSINLVAAGLGKLLKAGDAVLITEMEHHANIVPWQLLVDKGIQVKSLYLADNGELLLDDLESQLTPDVKVFAFTAVSNALGTVNPVQQMIARVRAVRPDMIILVDAAQAIAHMPIDVQAWDCDFLAFSGHKLYGPTGVGVLYGKRTWLEALPPYMGGGDMIRTVTLEKTTFNDIPYKFEAGTPNIEGVLALAPAIAFVESLGWSAIMAHEQALLAQATQALQQIDGLRIIGTAAHKEAVVSFIVDGVHPSDMATLLGYEQICLRASHHCAQPVMQRYQVPATVRASFAAYNQSSDIEKLVAGVEMAVGMLR
ncbi:MAG TPA: cysteine desulfurase [Thiotrichales bacterium]|nr:MAG: cysteine sulfinate desulfinase [Thiotrichales bacterium 35-46-9]OZA73834.1 MAG: cysteine sulfinate desulfinase [Thiotrichales bacterium 39-47-5]HQR82247.1 cysteine desulfurase [Thiotrichales bacterium]